MGSESPLATGLKGMIDALSLAGSDGTILWPRRCTGDPDAIERTLALVDHFVGLARHGTPAAVVGFEVPLLDLTPAQVLDLTANLGAPLGASWPCEEDAEQPCGSCASCQLWIEASRASGRPLPWAGAAVPG